MFQPPFLHDIIVANLILGISKLLISLSCPASWSLCNHYRFDTPLPNTKCILNTEIWVRWIHSLALCRGFTFLHFYIYITLCNAKKVALGIRSGTEGLRIFQIGTDPKQDLASEKIPLLRAPDQSMQGTPQLLPGVGCLLGYSEVCMPGVDLSCPLIAMAHVSFKMSYEASV